MRAEYFNSATTALLEDGNLGMDRNRPYRASENHPGPTARRTQSDARHLALPIPMTR